jgi:hypothetical protein
MQSPIPDVWATSFLKKPLGTLKLLVQGSYFECPVMREAHVSFVTDPNCVPSGLFQAVLTPSVRK